jgi:hypothetical protein
MKRQSLTTLTVLLCACAWTGCKEYKRIDMNQVNQIEDSVLKSQIVPHTSFVHILQDDDYTKASVVVGNARLYDDKDNIQSAAIRTGMMLLRVLGPDNNLSTGVFVVSKKDNAENKLPDDGISADMRIDSLKKVLYPKK